MQKQSSVGGGDSTNAEGWWAQFEPMGKLLDRGLRIERGGCGFRVQQGCNLNAVDSFILVGSPKWIPVGGGVGLSGRVGALAATVGSEVFVHRSLIWELTGRDGWRATTGNCIPAGVATCGDRDCGEGSS